MNNEFMIYDAIDKYKAMDILEKIKNVRVGVIGDICLDIYWHADMKKSKLSRETPHFPLPVIAESFAPGGAGNVARNAKALCSGVMLIGILGNDWRGELLKKELLESGISVSSIVSINDRYTETYCKPTRKGISDIEYEDPRIDFSNYEFISQETEDKLLAKIDRIEEKVDILCVADQMAFGCITQRIKDKLNSLALDGLKIVIDSRTRIVEYKNMVLKPNNIEGYEAVYGEKPGGNIGLDDYIEVTKKLAQNNNAKVFMTLGPEGCIYSNGDTTSLVKTFYLKPPIDTVGAGDTFIAALSCSLAAGFPEYESSAFANLCASVIIKKVGETGVAFPNEIVNFFHTLII